MCGSDVVSVNRSRISTPAASQTACVVQPAKQCSSTFPSRSPTDSDGLRSSCAGQRATHPSRAVRTCTSLDRTSATLMDGRCAWLTTPVVLMAGMLRASYFGRFGLADEDDLPVMKINLEVAPELFSLRLFQHLDYCIHGLSPLVLQSAAAASSSSPSSISTSSSGPSSAIRTLSPRGLWARTPGRPISLGG